LEKLNLVDTPSMDTVTPFVQEAFDYYILSQKASNKVDAALLTEYFLVNVDGTVSKEEWNQILPTLLLGCEL
jgi:hypothetical protein